MRKNHASLTGLGQCPNSLLSMFHLWEPALWYPLWKRVANVSCKELDGRCEERSGPSVFVTTTQLCGFR